MKPLISSGMDWNFDLIEDVYGHVEKIAKEKYKLDVYPNQLEIISSEQMLDAYCSVGLPVNYPHWSYGEQFIKQKEAYTRGLMGLAYEIVINSNPCIAYLMEENSALMQTLVIAHASFGHNTFFKNNYLFKQWTEADAIIDYLLFAKRYIRECEEKYGYDEVEAILDAAHALKNYGVNRYKRAIKLSAKEEEKLQRERDDYNQKQRNLLWSTIPITKTRKHNLKTEQFPKEPQENLLYFIEKNAPRLKVWQREIIRIVRQLSQYFYPQQQTKIMNEGCATFWHHTIINDLYDNGIVDESAMLEFYKSHTNVVYQPDFDNPRFNGINPYALGFAMFKDIQRVTIEPTQEDRDWFRGQDWVGSGDWVSVIKFAIENFKDESFINQYLTPKVIRDLRLFSIHDDEFDPKLEVSGIHNKQGYKTVRNVLAKQNNLGYMIPDIQVVYVDRWGDRSLHLTHTTVNNRPLNTDDTNDTLNYIRFLWGYNVHLKSVDNDRITATYSSTDEGPSVEMFVND